LEALVNNFLKKKVLYEKTSVISLTMIEFYNVKKKTKVKIPEEDIEKVKIEKPSKNGSVRVRYALKAVDDDGTKLTRFCSEADFNKLN